MQIASPTFELNGCQLWNYCQLRGWSENRASIESFLPQSLLLPESIDVPCEPEQCCCPARCINTTHTAPFLTGASWFVPTRPESGEFFGWFPTSHVVSRTNDDRLEMTIVMLAVASTAAGLHYGTQWTQRLIESETCATVRWRQACQSYDAIENLIIDDGWRTACNARVTAFVSSEAPNTGDTSACIAQFTLTIQAECSTGDTQSTATGLVTEQRKPAPAAGLCRKPATPATRTPTWLQRTNRQLTLTQTRWVDPYIVYAPPLTLITPRVPAWSGAALTVRIDNTFNECPIYNLRVDIVRLDGAVDCATERDLDPSPMPQTFDQVRNADLAWVGLIPEIPARTRLTIGADCTAVPSASTADGTSYPAPGWILGSAKLPLADPPRFTTGPCAEQFAVIVFADATIDDNGTPVTPCNIQVCVTAALLHTPVG
jgi:hypothetical protein